MHPRSLVTTFLICVRDEKMESERGRESSHVFVFELGSHINWWPSQEFLSNGRGMSTRAAQGPSWKQPHLHDPERECYAVWSHFSFPFLSFPFFSKADTHIQICRVRHIRQLVHSLHRRHDLVRAPRLPLFQNMYWNGWTEEAYDILERATRIRQVASAA